MDAGEKGDGTNKKMMFERSQSDLPQIELYSAIKGVDDRIETMIWCCIELFVR